LENGAKKNLISIKHQSNAAICPWLKPDKRIELLQLLKTETAPAKLAMKGHYKQENPELEDELYKWFLKHEQRQSVITDDLVCNKALKLGIKRALVDFKASRCWVKKFKEDTIDRADFAMNADKCKPDIR
jgi:hypothetical protein